MTHQLGWKSWATGALVLAAVSACGGNGANPPTSAPASTPPSAAMTSDSPPNEPTAQAADEAEAAIRRYYAVLDQLGADPKSNLSKLGAVATSTQLSAMRTVLRQQRRNQDRQSGSLVVTDMKVQSVNLDDSDPSAGKVPAVVIDVCWDVSNVNVIDAHGTSVISPSRPDRGATRLTVANYKYASDPHGGWRVATGQDLKEAPCAAS